MSFRCGASPGPRESIPTNMTSSQPSPVAITNSVSIVAPNESNENGSSFRHSNASPTSVSSASDELPPPRRKRPCGVTSPSSARRAPWVPWHSASAVISPSEHEPKPPMKSWRPRIAKTSWRAKTTPATLPTAGITWKRLVMINFIPGLRESSRRGRRTRRVRSERRERSCGTAVAKRQRRETQTIEKSSTFHPERR